ncbi:hypothetical protein H4219_006034, partial [Mycoemilia scoparia]
MAYPFGGSDFTFQFQNPNFNSFTHNYNPMMNTDSQFFFSNNANSYNTNSAGIDYGDNVIDLPDRGSEKSLTYYYECGACKYNFTVIEEYEAHVSECPYR